MESDFKAKILQTWSNGTYQFFKRIYERCSDGILQLGQTLNVLNGLKSLE